MAAVYDLPASLFDDEPVPLRWHPGLGECWFDRPGKGLVSRPTTAPGWDASWRPTWGP